MREQAEVSADVLIADGADERRKHACDLGRETQSSFAAARRPHSAARFHNRDFAYGQKPSQQMRNYIVRILSVDFFFFAYVGFSPCAHEEHIVPKHRQKTDGRLAPTAGGRKKKPGRQHPKSLWISPCQNNRGGHWNVSKQKTL